MNSDKTNNEIAHDEIKNNKPNRASKDINNNAKSNKDLRQSDDQAHKHNIEKPTHETPTRDQHQTLKSKDDGKNLSNQRIGKLRKITNPRQTTDDDENNEEHKMEENDLHTTGDARNNNDDVTITPTQRIGKIQQIDSSRQTTDDKVSNQEQKMEEIDSNPRPASLPWP